MACRLVMLVKLVKKVILAVPNASVAMRVKQEPVPVADANNVPPGKLVNPRMQPLLLAPPVLPDVIKMNWAKLPAYLAFLEHLKIEMVQQNVKIAALDNIKMRLAMKPV